MREDFNKLLTERERIGHRDCFHQIRNTKKNATFDEDARGGKVSIHAHRRQGVKVNRKSFNENLNPLRYFLRDNVGRPWDKVFSELNQAFDRRKVVNNHIFQHLFDYVEINAKLVDGKICVLNSYRQGGREYDYKTKTYTVIEDYYDKRWTPIKEDSCEWYVHPVDGLLKVNVGKISKKARQLKNKKAREAATFAIFRKLDKYHELHKVDGIWYVYTLKDRPAKVEQVTMPSSWFGYEATQKWHKLSKAEQRAIGQVAMVSPAVKHVDAPRVNDVPMNMYYAERNTASSKILKQHDLVGDAEEPEVQEMSARERSKYRKAA